MAITAIAMVTICRVISVVPYIAEDISGNGITARICTTSVQSSLSA
jgi:hypothetical protein